MWTPSFSIAAAVCLAGITWRLFRLLRTPGGFTPGGDRHSLRHRLAALLGGLVGPSAGRRWGRMMTTAVLDGLLQLRVWRTDRLGWIMHMCLFWGFLPLLVFHAFEDDVTRPLFRDYASTLNPYLFLRNAFGLLAAIGLTLAAGRRLLAKGYRRLSGPGDWLPLALIALILVSGFLLESAKIISETVFDDMLEDYLGSDDPAEVVALRAWWQESYGVVFETPVDAATPGLLEAGRMLDDQSCTFCHSPAPSAFVSYPLSRGLAPVAGALNRWRADIWLGYLHYMACFLLLAVAPFGKMAHLVATPLTLFLRRCRDMADPHPAPTASRRSVALDGCTHCGVCSQLCSVAPMHRILGIPEILPSEKLTVLRTLLRRSRPEAVALATFAEANAVCTRCLRCTEFCPSGIDLQDLWNAAGGWAAAAGMPEVPIRVAGRSADQWAERFGPAGTGVPAGAASIPRYPILENPRLQLFHCVQCSTCTGVCPVVEAHAEGATDLDVTPQQVMNLLRLNLRELALGSRMVWDCVTCYLCQEHCPQDIAVADILYELRNEAWARIGSSAALEKGFPEAPPEALTC
jgi:heterodisulfide reductase subunit C/nitrate reductase gamma subunit